MKITSLLFTLGFFYNILNADTSSWVPPDHALQRLVEGNQRYINDKLLHPDRTKDRRESVSSKQTPLAIILGCSDSRVSPEIIFDQGLGDLFIVRVAGNVLGSIELNSIEFAADKLQASLILVLGHENCGAVSAVLNNDTKDIKSIASLIQLALKNTSNLSLEAAVKDNVRYVMQSLKQSPILTNLIQQNKLKIHGGYYNLDHGTVSFINP
jgi:carbonic anhydrase